MRTRNAYLSTPETACTFDGDAESLASWAVISEAIRSTDPVLVVIREGCSIDPVTKDILIPPSWQSQIFAWLDYRTY